MFRGLALAIALLAAIGLNVSEGHVRTIYTWRSYIRTPKELQETFESDVKGMEALIHLADNGQPVLGIDSTFSVEEFVDLVIDHHNRLENEMPTKYVVFYFYETDDITVVQKTVDILKRKENEINFPIWLRAAIAEGLDTCDDRKYKVFGDAIGFTEQVTRLDNVVLGVRGTTCKVDDTTTGAYTKKHTDEMFSALQQAKVLEKKGQAINFFIRGHHVTRSQKHLLELFKKVSITNPVTFTIFTDEQYFGEDTAGKPAVPHNITALREAIKFLGPENVFLQVSDEIRRDLDLRGLSNPRPTHNKAPMLVRMNFISLIPLIAVTFVGIFSF